MNKRDIVLGLLEGGANTRPSANYTPAAFFLHFDAQSKVGAGAIAKHREFFRFTDMDFVKIQYELPFPPQPVERPEDWSRIRPLTANFFEPQLEVVRALVDAFRSEALVIVTLYSPFMCAGNVGGREALTEHLRTAPDLVKPGMEAVTESLLIFVRECVKLGVDGFYHSTQGGESRRFADRRIFLEYVKPYDLQLMKEANQSSQFNILHVCDYHREQWGGYDDLTPFADYPGQVVNSSLEVGDRLISPKEIASIFGRPFFGGMDRKGPLATGTPEEAREAARAVLQDVPERFILGADCTVPNETPWENLKSAIQAAHGVE